MMGLTVVPLPRSLGSTSSKHDFFSGFPGVPDNRS